MLKQLEPIIMFSKKMSAYFMIQNCQKCFSSVFDRNPNNHNTFSLFTLTLLNASWSCYILAILYTQPPFHSQLFYIALKHFTTFLLVHPHLIIHILPLILFFMVLQYFPCLLHITIIHLFKPYFYFMLSKTVREPWIVLTFLLEKLYLLAFYIQRVQIC